MANSELIDPHWVLEPDYRIEGVWDDGNFRVTRADDKVVLSRQFLDDLAMGLTRVDATLDIKPCECGRQCFHGAIMTVDPNGLAIMYRLTEQIENRTVWWAERYHGGEQIIQSAPWVVNVASAVTSVDRFGATIEVRA